MNTGAASDLEHCRALMQAGSKSFTAASKLLPRRVRGPATAFYAFCRVADDLVDDNDDPRSGVAELQTRLDAIFSGSPRADPVDRAFARIVEAHEIPRVLIDALIDGFAWDAEERDYESLSDVLAYSARVASTVGVVMTVFMGVRDATTLARACDMGVAMQLTNIARDVAEDAERGRCYLPAAWLREVGMGDADIGECIVPDPRLNRVVERLLDRADELYLRADTGIPRLPSDCRASIRAARLIYSDIGRVIRSHDCDPFFGRAVTTRGRKLWLLLRAFAGAGGPGEANPHDASAPPLPEVEFLVQPFVPVLPLVTPPK